MRLQLYLDPPVVHKLLSLDLPATSSKDDRAEYTTHRLYKITSLTG